MTDLEFLKLSGPQKKLYKLGAFFASIPGRLLGALKGLGKGITRLFLGFGNWLKTLVLTFKNGDWKTRLSYLIMGFGSCARGQWGRGILFFLFQTVFNLYMFFPNASMSGFPNQPYRTVTAGPNREEDLLADRHVGKRGTAEAK